MSDDRSDRSKPQEKPVFSPSQESRESTAELPLDSKGVLDQLDEPGGLKVAEMPESNELQERRKKTKSSLQELGSLPEVEGEEGGEAFQDEEGGLMDVLREANLSSRHLKFCCSGILVVAFLIGLFFGGRFLWNYWQKRPETELEGEEGTEEESLSEGENSEEASFLDPSLWAGILLGQEREEEDESTEVGEDLGEAEVARDLLTQKILDFKRLYESMQVDVNELLNQSSDRRGTLKEYQEELNHLLYLGRGNVEDLTEENRHLQDLFNLEEASKDLEEERFFAQMEDLDAYASVAALENFVEHAEVVVELRAQFNARERLLGFYEDLLEAMERRLIDIQLNEEALVKGVHVVEVEGSDLDLILDEEDL